MNLPPDQQRRRHILLILVLISIGLLRITATYRIFWQTWDEPARIAAGMQWLTAGQYTYERFTPPLACVMGAVGPYLAGIRSTGQRSMWEEGNAILQANHAYESNLTLARVGLLPFFVLAALVVAVWAHRDGGATPAFFAVLLLTTTPSILALSGVAGLDMACAACVVAALFAFERWLQRPTWAQSCLLGVTGGLAILTKFTAIGFLMTAGGLLVLVHGFQYFRKPARRDDERFSARRWFIAILLALLFCFLVIWAGYRFSTGYLLVAGPHEKVDQVFGTQGLFHNAVYFGLEKIPVPAPEFRQGIQDALVRNESGGPAYLLGQIREGGWWYFFPVALLVKAPLPLLLLSAIGFFFVFRNIFTQQATLPFLTPAVSVIGILGVGMLASVDNGSRQVLAIYPLLALVAGYGAAKLLAWPRRFHTIGLALAIGLLAWQLIDSAVAHPDYLAYFNQLGRAHPEEILVDGDLDWGQDLKRLVTTLKDRDIHELTLQYNGSRRIHLEQFDLPPWQKLEPYQPTTGWVAISIYNLTFGTEEPPYDQFTWLKKYQPVEKIGKSIWLYSIPESAP